MSGSFNGGVLVLTFSVFLLAGCQHSPDRGDDTARDGALGTEKRVADRYNEEIREVISLARRNEWDEARTQASALYALDPEDPEIERIYNWVEMEIKRRQQKAMEEELRDIEAQDSRFSPSVRSILFDRRSRGLSLPTDLRNTLDELSRQPLVPDSFNRVIERQGPLYDFERAPRAMDEVLRRKVSIQLDNVTLEEIVFTLGRSENINFVADRNLEAFGQTLSVQMEDVEMSEFLDYVSRNFGIHFHIGPNLVWIVDGDTNSNRLEETRFYRLRRGFIMPAEFGASQVRRETRGRGDDQVVVETQQIEKFVRDNAPGQPSIEQAIERFFKGSDYMIDFERNLIVATGTPVQLRTLERIIEQFDQPVQQVLIEARFVTVTEAAFLQLGTIWETTGDPRADRRVPEDFTGFGTDVGRGLARTFTNVLSVRNLNATLTALEQSGESQTLSSPRLTVVNNRPATISDGKRQFYYEEYEVSQQVLERRSSSTLVPKGRPTELRSGVSLDVLASIGGDGESIMLALKPKVKQDVELVTFATVSDFDEDGNVIKDFEIRLPESRDQEISTRVVVRSSETVVMGGVMENVQTTFTEAVPILGNLPIIGAAFRRQTEFEQPRYLLIFVTATLLSESGEFIQQNALR